MAGARPRLQAVVLAMSIASLAGRSATAGSDTHYQDSVIGERGAGMGGAFTALADEATGAYYNPAGIAVDRSTLIQVSMSAYKLRYKKVGVLDLCGKQLEVDDSSYFGFPAAFGFVKLLGSGQVRHAIGLTLTVPQAEKASQSTMVRDADCGLFQMDGSLGRIDVDRLFAGGLSYAVRPWSWLAAGLTAGVAVRGVTSTSILALLGKQGGATTYPELVFTNVEATVWSLFLQLGTIVEPVPGLRFGVSLTSPYLQVSGNGRLDQAAGSGDPDDWHLTGLQAVDDVGFNWKTPLRLALGLAYQRPSRFALAADVSFHPPVAAYRVVEPHPLVDDATELSRELVVNLNLGAELFVGRRLVLRGGLFTNFSSHPAVDTSDPEAVFSDHVDQFGASLGISLATDEHSRLGLVVQGQVGSGETLRYRLAGTGDPDSPVVGSVSVAGLQAYSLIVSVGGSVELQ